MAGSPIRRARRERVAREARQGQQTQSSKPSQMSDPEVEAGKYTEAIAAEIVAFVAAGVPIDDTRIGANVAKLGIESRVGISARTIYRWQREKPEFAAAIDKAREESSHRAADQIMALAQMAIEEPTLANGIRVAMDGIKWSAMVRNRSAYGDKSEVTVKTGPSWIDVLKEIEERRKNDPGFYDYTVALVRCGSCGDTNIFEDCSKRPVNCVACSAPLPRTPKRMPDLPLPLTAQLDWVPHVPATRHGPAE